MMNEKVIEMTNLFMREYGEICVVRDGVIYVLSDQRSYAEWSGSFCLIQPSDEA